MTWIKASLLWSASIVLSAIPTLAQGTVSFSIGDSRPILNAPYSIFEETEHSQTLSDGTHMATKHQTRLYRDSSGRTRKESFTNRSGPNEPTTVEIHDPVANTAYTLFVRQRVAQPIAPPVGFPNKPNVVYKSDSTVGDVRPKSTSEDLGTQSIEGIPVEGVRTTTVYPEGLMGNDRPIQTVSERWVSKELGLTLSEKYSDPRFGEQVTHVTHLDRSEPDPALFQVPQDYILQEPNTK
jgi:hypothetical protein